MKHEESEADSNSSSNVFEISETYDVIVAAQQNNILVTAFHPELTEDTRWHKYFLNIVKNFKNNTK